MFRKLSFSKRAIDPASPIWYSSLVLGLWFQGQVRHNAFSRVVPLGLIPRLMMKVQSTWWISCERSTKGVLRSPVALLVGPLQLGGIVPPLWYLIESKSNLLTRNLSKGLIYQCMTIIMNAKQCRCWRRETSAFRQVSWWEASAQASKTLRERNWTSNLSKEDSQFHSQVPKLTKSRQKKKEHTNQDRLSRLIWIWQKLGNIFF